MAAYLYLLDTNALIELYRSYPPDVFESVWDSVDKLIVDERAFSCREVKAEIKDMHGGDLYKWAQKQDGFFREPDTAITKLAGKITEETDLVDPESAQNKADPWVVAHAKHYGARVVTLERSAKTKAKMKIPDACKKYNVAYSGLFGMMRQEGWKF